MMHSMGGKSDIDNIMVLCSKCHDELHGKDKIELPTEDEMQDEDNSDEDSEEKENSSSTWAEDVKKAVTLCGGEAPLSDIYERIKPIRKPIGEHYKAAVRNTLERNSRGRGCDIFEPLNIGSGVWKLKK